MGGQEEALPPVVREEQEEQKSEKSSKRSRRSKRDEVVAALPQIETATSGSKKSKRSQEPEEYGMMAEEEFAAAGEEAEKKSKASSKRSKGSKKSKGSAKKAEQPEVAAMAEDGAEEPAAAEPSAPAAEAANDAEEAAPETPAADAANAADDEAPEEPESPAQQKPTKKAAAPAQRDPDSTLPGEFADGRMGADISLLISEITEQRNKMVQHTEIDITNLEALMQEIDFLQYRMQKIDQRMVKRLEAKKQYEKTFKNTEIAYNEIVNTANELTKTLAETFD